MGGKIRSYTASVIVVLAGVSLSVFGYVWPPSRAEVRDLFAPLLRPIANDFRYWLAMIVLLWVTTLFPVIRAKQITSLDEKIGETRNGLAKDIGVVRANLNCWAKPRRLTPDQISKISAYLSAHDPQEVTFNIVKDDNEASNYRSDFDMALRQGGWTVAGYNYIDSNSLCIGGEQLTGGVAQVESYCLQPGYGVLCTPRPEGAANPNSLSCSGVVAAGHSPIQGAPRSTHAPCFMAVGSNASTFTWSQSAPVQVPEGLGVSYFQTQAHMQVPPDSKHPKANELLLEAFRLANVQPESTSGGGAEDKDSLSITIGRRRHDGIGPGCPQTIMKEETVPAPE
jgi:hypothetical protein